MLAIRIAASPELAQWQYALTATEQQIQTAAVRALNKSARWMHNRVAHEVADPLNIRISAVRASLVLLRAKNSSPESGIALASSAGVIKASQLGSPSQNARGVRVGARQFDHGFLATMPNGHQGVFRRRGATRLPIQEVQLVITGRIADAMQTLADGAAMQQFRMLFERELRYLMRAA